jgi:hypothetical protein
LPLVVGSGVGNQGLTIYSGTAGYGGIHFADGTTSTDSYRGIVYYQHTNDSMQFWTSATERMRIDSSGNVGIGTASPDQRVTINSANTSTNSLVSFKQAGTTYAYVGMGSDNKLRLEAVSTDVGIQADSANVIFFNTNGSERARITTGGDFLVGCTANPSSTVVGVRLGKTATQGFGMSAVGGTGSLEHWYYYNPNGLVGTITTSGSATAYNTSSDRRLKENIAPADDAGALVDAIQIVKHDWKVGGHTRYGAVAQDLYEVVPEAVAKGDDGEEIEKTWGVDYSKLVPILVKEIQSLRARVAALEAK